MLSDMKRCPSIIDALEITTVFAIRFKFCTVLTIRLKIRRLIGFLCLKRVIVRTKKMCTPQRMCALERAQSASGAQFVQACDLVFFLLIIYFYQSHTLF